MCLVRLVYFSENRLGFNRRGARLAELQKTCARNNQRNGISGALVHDDLWFLQVIEGEETKVDDLFNRIKHDPRHGNPTVLGRKYIHDREFGKWAMGFATRTPENAHLFGAHWCNEGLNPHKMTAEQVLDLMMGLYVYDYLGEATPLEELEPDPEAVAAPEPVSAKPKRVPEPA